MKGQDDTYPRNESATTGGTTVLGHELGNVLNGLLGMTELLLGDDPRPEQEQWLRAIEQSGLQMRRLVDAFSGVETESIPGSPVDGIALLEDTIVSHAPAALRKKNRLLLLTAPEVPRYWHCDPCRLRQILDNLLANAIRFSRAGEITVDVSADRSVLKLRVGDSGPGIRRGAERLLFQPFHQNLHREGDGSPGRGLGLYVCRVNARAMLGGIRWAAGSGGGSIFELRLPHALASSIGPESIGQGAWLRGICCVLNLEEPLRRSVRCFLARLGVASGVQDISGQGDGSKAPVILVGEVPGSERGSDVLELRLEGTNSRPPVVKRLQAPILESGLASALMELVLAWRADRVSAGDNPG